jgi:ADP-ribose pyrophosphatase YjhB (NUDIX family)
VRGLRLNDLVLTGSHGRFAGVLARHQRQVVLVREEYPSWGGAYWNIPSGRIEEYESPAEGARRELAEETGLVVPLAGLVLQGTSATASPHKVSRAWNFTVDVDNPALEVSDPDGLIQDARWFSAEEAIRLLRELPYRPLSEPAVAILTGQVSVGAHWEYPDPTGEPIIAVQER